MANYKSGLAFPFTFGKPENQDINITDNLAALTRWNETVIKRISSSLTSEQTKRYERFLSWFIEHYNRNDITINSDALMKFKSVELVVELIGRCEALYTNKKTVENALSLNDLIQK